MKKMIALLLAVLFVFSLVACGEKDKTEDTKGTEAPEKAEADATESDGETLDGGWSDTQSIVVTDDVKALFDKANEKLAGAQYEPIAVLETQVVAGANYLVLCKETATVPNAVTTYALVTLYADPEGNAEITDIKNSGVAAPEAYDPENPVAGGYSEPESYEVTEEVKTALKTSYKSVDGVSLEPKALLGTQIVAGTNYRILCKSGPVVPNAASTYVIVTVYADLEGNAELTETVDFSAADDAEQAEEATQADEGKEIAASSEAE